MRRPYLPDKAREHLMAHIQNWLQVCDADDLEELYELVGYGGEDDLGALTPAMMRESWHTWLDNANDDQVVQFHHDLIMGNVARDAESFMDAASNREMPDEDDGTPTITPSA
jgi:hypothetical protein